MAKVRKMYICQNCEAEYPRWSGQCRGCGSWNCLEESDSSQHKGSFGFGRQSKGTALRAQNNAPIKIADIQAHSYERIVLPMDEFNRVLGGGIVPGSLVLVGGAPGIGKTTLLGQASGMMADAMGPVLYISGEESIYQVKMRAERLGVGDKDVYLVSETHLDTAIAHIHELKPKAVIIDSIQTMYLEDIPSSAGSITQVRECAARLMQLAKSKNVPIFLVGHVTKEGSIAGPRVLEHIVDTVLYLEGDRSHAFRLLRAQKNRFGSTDEVGVFEMTGEGMLEVENPSTVFLTDHQIGITGSAIAVTIEGTRSLLIELQALVSPSNFNNPRRTTNGVDRDRFYLLLAVLNKRVGIQMESQDIFVNVVGGLKIHEPASDLAIAAAIASSYSERPLRKGLTLLGELGLGGEVRPVSQLEKRLQEAAKLGFTHCIIPKSGRSLPEIEGLTTLPVQHILEALHHALEASTPQEFDPHHELESIHAAA